MKAPNFWHNDGFIPRILEPTAQIFNLFSQKINSEME